MQIFLFKTILIINVIESILIIVVLVMISLHMSLTKEQEVQLAACKGLVIWMLACSAIRHSVSWKIVFNIVL